MFLTIVMYMYYEVLLQPRKPLKIGDLSTVSKNMSMARFLSKTSLTETSVIDTN